MIQYLWCEDRGAGFQFREKLCGTLYPEMVVETKMNNSGLRRAAGRICDDGNQYYILLDTAVDNPDVLREHLQLKKSTEGKENVRILGIHSFEFALLSFEMLEQWVFDEKDDLRTKRRNYLQAKDLLVRFIVSGGSPRELTDLKALLNYPENRNTEQLCAGILYGITRNTGFETDKGTLGACFYKSCCELSGRQPDDICGLDKNRITAERKMREIFSHSAIQSAFMKAGL